MRELVKHRDVPLQQVPMRRGFAKQNGFLAKKSYARMLHSPVCEARNQNHLVFRKWKWLREERGEVCDPVRRDPLDLRRLGGCARKFGLPHIERGSAVGPFQLSKWPGGKCK